MKAICENDGIQIDPHSLEEIAKNGAGSMRDAQSLLDQVIAFCGKEIDPGAVESVLGIVGQSALATFVDCVAQRDAAGLLQQVSEVIAHGKDLGYFCRDLIGYLRNLLLVKVAGNAESLLSGQTTHLDTLKKQAASFEPDELQQMFQVLSKAEMEMKRSSLPQILFEMAVLRLTDVRPMQEIDALIDKINTMEGPSATGGGTPAPVRGEAPSAQKSPPAPAQSAPKRQEPVEPVDPSISSTGAWQKIRSAASGIKRSLGTYLDNCQLTALEAREMRLSFPDQFTMGQMEKEENLAALKEAVAEVCGKPDMKITLQLAIASAPAEDIATPPEPEHLKDNSPAKKSSGSEEEILKDALDVFGGIVIK